MPRTCSQAVLIGATLAIALAGASLVANPVDDEDRAPAPAQVAAADLTGLWSRFEGKAEGEPIRFWYFHGDGKGLYRYGRVGLNNTNSFDYDVVDGKVELQFRKTGERHRLGVSIQTDGEGDRWLRFDGDPKEPGARYRKERGGMEHGERVASSGGGPGGRIWIDYRNWATGGSGFRMYQLNDAAIDGRGIGWFHEGDFDDWSTESLTYRIDAQNLELYFDLREQPAMTRFSMGEARGQRWLELDEDPRDFWARHRFVDGGKSFGGAEVWHWVTHH